MKWGNKTKLVSDINVVLLIKNRPIQTFQFDYELKCPVSNQTPMNTFCFLLKTNLKPNVNTTKQFFCEALLITAFHVVLQGSLFEYSSNNLSFPK